jgi:phosphohistidine phosphatase
VVNRLILIRHAKSAHPAGVSDHDRPLNERGRHEARLLGEWLAGLTVPDQHRSVVVVSTAMRAQETWLEVRSAAGAGWSAVPVEDDSDVYEASPSALRRSAADHCDGRDLIVMVGHNPGMSLLARELVSPTTLFRDLPDGFATSTAAVLDTPADWSTALAGVATFELSSSATPRG